MLIILMTVVFIFKRWSGRIRVEDFSYGYGDLGKVGGLYVWK